MSHKLMNDKEKFELYFEALTAFHAEGARVGVTSCKSCGAAVMMDPRSGFDAAKQHILWHEEMAQ